VTGVNCSVVKFRTELCYLVPRLKSACRYASIPGVRKFHDIFTSVRCAVTLRHYVTLRNSVFITLKPTIILVLKTVPNVLVLFAVISPTLRVLKAFGGMEV
jgi:hypothetical protein